MCALAGVSRAVFYRGWGEASLGREETALRDAIQRPALTNRHYGYRRIGQLLRREGWWVNHKRLVRIMREDNLLCLRKPMFRPATTDSRHGWRLWPNLARQVMPMAVNQLWVADITYVRLDEQFVYLAVILDAYSRKVVGWAMADHLRASLALDALEMALATRDIIPRRAHPSLRSGHPVGLRRLLHRPPRGRRRPAQHEPGRLSVRQCHG
jgi:putative transposase